MTWLTVFRVFLALLLTGAVSYLAFQIWRRAKNRGASDRAVDFRPTIGFTRLDGWASLAILLRNKSESNVWVEEIEIALADIAAYDQTCEATSQEVQKIRQTVQSNDMLPVSLVETIYKAAGKPQRRYSCLISSLVRYRVGEDWYEEPIQPYKLKMAGLTVISNHRERWSRSKFTTRDRPRGPRRVPAKSS